MIYVSEMETPEEHVRIALQFIQMLPLGTLDSESRDLLREAANRLWYALRPLQYSRHRQPSLGPPPPLVEIALPAEAVEAA